MTINYTTKTTREAFEFENEAYKGNGHVEVDNNNKISQVNGTIYKDGAYAGSFSSHQVENNELKLNINGVSAENLASVAEIVNSVSSELKTKYSV